LQDNHIAERPPDAVSEPATVSAVLRSRWLESASVYWRGDRLQIVIGTLELYVTPAGWRELNRAVERTIALIEVPA
jgi:hypothetical protein